jgi:hypothetical protein
LFAVVFFWDATEAVNRDNKEIIITDSNKPAPEAKLQVTVLLPNGGETLQAGTCFNITWTASGGNGTLSVTLRYSTSGRSGPLGLIKDKLPNNGSYMWVIPNTSSNDCFVNITVEDQSVPIEADMDDSDSAFTIDSLPLNIKVLIPNGGENWTTGLVKTIRWDAWGGYGTLHVELEYSVDNKSTYLVIDPDIIGKNYSSWVVPNTITTKSECYIRATVTDNSAPFPKMASDESDSSFTIYVPLPVPESPPPALALVLLIILPIVVAVRRKEQSGPASGKTVNQASYRILLKNI